jgi:hypothetical protein
LPNSEKNKRGYAIIWKYTREKQLKKKERGVVDTKTDSWIARRKVSWKETQRSSIWSSIHPQ